MSRIIAVANHKGGVAKTTTAYNLAGVYAAEGRRVLLCDLDPQASLTKLFALGPEGIAATLADLLLGSHAAEAIHGTPLAGVSLIPANASLAHAEKQLIGRINRERTLARVLRPLVTDFDYVLLDCPPALDLLNTNGLAAADEVLVPLESSKIALDALPDFLATVAEIGREVNPALALLGIAITKHQAQTAHSQAILQALHERFPGKVFQSLIPYSVRAKDSLAARLPIASYDPKSPVAEAYRSLAREIAEGRPSVAQELAHHA